MSLPDYSSIKRARSLRDELAIRAAKFATPLDVAASQDNQGNPLIIVGSVAAAGTAGVTVRLRQIDWPLVTDSIGLPQKVYGPHVSEFIYEASITANTIELLQTVTLLLGQLGTRVDTYRCANGTAADYTQFIAGNLQHSFQPSLNFGSVGSV